MARALVTGTYPHLGVAAAAVGRAGFVVVTWEVTDAGNRRSFPGILRKSNAGMGADGPFDCYVQLPCGAPALTRGAADDLVVRMDVLAAVADRLTPTASVMLGLDDFHRPDEPEPGGLAPDLLVAVAAVLLEDLGRPAARLAVLPVAELCRRPAAAPAGTARRALQWEMPTPPLVSAP